FSRSYVEDVKEYLEMMDIPYTADKNLVRGLDSDNHTAFEIMSEADGFGALAAVLGGGGYLSLTERLGGPHVAGVAGGMGTERLMLAREAEGVDIPVDRELDTSIITMGNDAENAAVAMMHKLRKNGIQVDKDYQGRKMKAQFKAADRLQAKYAIIIGEDELDKQVVHIREMATGEQFEAAINDVLSILTERLSGGKKHGRT